MSILCRRSPVADLIILLSSATKVFCLSLRFKDRAIGYATTLRQAGVQHGDRVAIFLDKTADAVIALYGVWLAGAVAVPVYEGLRGRQVTHIVTHSESKILVSDERKLSHLGLEVADNVQVLTVDRACQ